jgi:hypothetical protein
MTSPSGPRPTGEVVAYYEAAGFSVVSSSPTLITLERTHSWLAVLFGAVVGLGHPTAFRQERLQLHVVDGMATVGTGYVPWMEPRS